MNPDDQMTALLHNLLLELFELLIAVIKDQDKTILLKAGRAVYVLAQIQHLSMDRHNASFLESPIAIEKEDSQK